MLYLSRTIEAELPQLYKLERLCHQYPWTLGILQDCLRVGYLCHTMRLCNEIEDQDLVAQIPIKLLDNSACCANPIGFMINQIILDECHLLTICVHPTLQGKGIAFAALSWLINLMREKQINTIFLEVRISNLKAIRLYQKLGFVQCAVRKDYYPAASGREDAALFKLKII